MSTKSPSINFLNASFIEAGEGIVQTVQAVGGLVGTLMTIYGRVRATKPLAQRSVALKL